MALVLLVIPSLEAAGTTKAIWEVKAPTVGVSPSRTIMAAPATKASAVAANTTLDAASRNETTTGVEDLATVLVYRTATAMAAGTMVANLATVRLDHRTATAMAVLVGATAWVVRKNGSIAWVNYIYMQEPELIVSIYFEPEVYIV